MINVAATVRDVRREGQALPTHTPWQERDKDRGAENANLNERSCSLQSRCSSLYIRYMQRSTAPWKENSSVQAVASGGDSWSEDAKSRSPTQSGRTSRDSRSQPFTHAQRCLIGRQAEHMPAFTQVLGS